LTVFAIAGLVTAGSGCGSSSSKPQFETKPGGPTAHERPLQPLDNTAPKGGTPKPNAVD